MKNDPIVLKSEDFFWYPVVHNLFAERVSTSSNDRDRTLLILISVTMRVVNGINTAVDTPSLSPQSTSLDLKEMETRAVDWSFPYILASNLTVIRASHSSVSIWILPSGVAAGWLTNKFTLHRTTDWFLIHVDKLCHKHSAAECDEEGEWCANRVAVTYRETIRQVKSGVPWSFCLCFSRNQQLGRSYFVSSFLTK